MPSSDANEDNADGGSESANRSQPTGELPNAAAPPNEAQRAEQHNRETARNRRKYVFRPVVRFFRFCDNHGSGATAIATVVLAVVTTLLARDSARQIKVANGALREAAAQNASLRDQLKEMQLEQRPWVSIVGLTEGGVVVSEPFNFEASGEASLRLSFFQRNTGKNPAFGVRWKGAIIPIRGTKHIQDELTDALVAICEPLRKLGAGVFEETIFPDEKAPATMQALGTSKRNIDLALQNQAGAVKIPGQLEFGAIICVDYKSADETHHQTRYSFEILAPASQPGVWHGFVKPEGVHPDMTPWLLMQSAD